MDNNAAVAASNSLPQLLIDHGELLKLFSCPVCQQLLRPPIPQCKKGHVMCEQCRPKLKGVCPICKQAVANQTNLMMEKIGALIKFPCCHSTQGCNQLVTLREQKHHEAECNYRRVHCQYCNEGCAAILCVHEMAEHVRKCHFRKS